MDTHLEHKLTSLNNHAWFQALQVHKELGRVIGQAEVIRSSEELERMIRGVRNFLDTLDDLARHFKAKEGL